MPGLARIVHLVDEVSTRNFGIWHAALASTLYLQDSGIRQILVSPPFQEGVIWPEAFGKVEIVNQSRIDSTSCRAFFAQYSPEDTLVISHGAWRFPTHWGAMAKRLGFTWIYTPHGMLEPWSLSQKWLKKKIYGELFEYRLARRADMVRAVGLPEAGRLQQKFSRVHHIPNGIYPHEVQNQPTRQPNSTVRYLFLARLHHKKGILPLLTAWKAFFESRARVVELCVAGTNDGEQEKVENWIQQNPGSGVRFLGPRFGKEKEELLHSASFYVLPSQSEGFPTSVLEAMAYGLIPLISEGCNFPEVFSEKLALNTGTEPETIRLALEASQQIPQAKRGEWAAKAREFVRSHYLWPHIAVGFLDWWNARKPHASSSFLEQ